MYPEFDGSQPCRQVDPELFFPESGTPIESRMAKDMCSSCKFQAPCLRYALAFQVAGIWGGTTEGERRRIRRQAGIVAVPLVPTASSMIVRLSRRGMSSALIATHLGVSERTVQRFILEDRRRRTGDGPSRPSGARQEDQQASRAPEGREAS
jgi:WhiB family redox-sensing transcriptional regulator